MDASTPRPLPPARIVALAVIVVVAAGLAYLRIGGGEDQVSLPPGAKAGDLDLERCDYATEAGPYAADCGTLVVPENRADPDSRLIALPVTRIRARSGDAGDPIFRLEGGPGLTNMVFPKASRVADRHDVVLVGYRGVDGSTVLECPEVSSALKHSSDFLAEASFRSYADAFRTCADRLRRDGVDLAGYSLAQRVDDLEAARTALGYDRIDLLSESAGTRTALMYAWRYPARIHRSAMIGANPPGHFLWDPRVTDEQIGRYSDLCAQDEGCRARTDDLAGLMRRTAGSLPNRWLLVPIEPGNVPLASFFGLIDSSPDAAPLSAPMTLHSWIAAADGDSSGFWFQSFAAQFAFPEAYVWGDTAAVSRVDANVAKARFASGGDRGSILRDAGTTFLWAGGALADAWPAEPDENDYGAVRTSRVESLVISGDLDFTTPPQIAQKELMPHLPNGHQVVLEGFGHTTDFWTFQPGASERLLNSFFDSGRIDDSLYRPQRVRFSPEVTQTALGKGFVGSMLGLGALTVFSLIWLGLRARRRNRIGPIAAALLRSLYTVVLGLGGWFVFVLLRMLVFRHVPLDNAGGAVLSIGIPIGLAIAFVWVRRQAHTSTRRLGLAASLAGGLVGAWLGFSAAGGLLALITAIAGAAAGANLMLIVLDIRRARRTPYIDPAPANPVAARA